MMSAAFFYPLPNAAYCDFLMYIWQCKYVLVIVLCKIVVINRHIITYPAPSPLVNIGPSAYSKYPKLTEQKACQIRVATGAWTCNWWTVRLFVQKFIVTKSVIF